MTRLTAPVMCSSIISNYEDNEQSTSEYNGSSTLTPSTTYNGMGSNATTISSQSSLNNYGIGDFNQQSTHLTNSINNNTCSNNNNFNNNNDFIGNNNLYHQQQQQQNDETSTRQQSANYYGVNDLKEASWRKQANTSGAMTCDFYGGSGKSTTDNRNQHYNNNDVANVNPTCRYGSQTSVCTDKLVQPIHTIIPPYNATLTHNANNESSTRPFPKTMGCCSDSLDDVSGVFDQMSIQSELISSSLARHHYDNLENNKYFESLSARESSKPSNVIMDQQNQPNTLFPKPTRLRDSPHLTRTYSMIGQSRRGHVDLDKSMTLNRHERRFITRNIASVLSKPRPPPTIPSIPQLTPTITSSPLNQHNNDYVKDRLVTHSYQEYQPNSSQDEYADARDSSFLSCASQPTSLDKGLSDSTLQKKKHNGGTLSNLGSRITLATKGKTMQNQIANLRKFFSSAPKRKSFIGSNKKSSLFDTTDGDMFLNRRCPSAEALTNDSPIKSMPANNPDRNSVFSSCSVKEDGFDYKSYTPTSYSNNSVDAQDIISINSNSSRLNYIKEIHRQSGEYVVSQNNRKLTTLFEEQPRKYPPPPPDFTSEFASINTSLGQFDCTAKPQYQTSSLSFTNVSLAFLILRASHIFISILSSFCCSCRFSYSYLDVNNSLIS